ncbi:MAG: hypothetical protein M3R63_01765 [Actinomycetota bacterium]|nr:hypothetical protein [Actinomycetota bacterium]
MRDNNAAEPPRDPWPLTTREKEHSRLVADGERTDNGERCSLVLVHETGGTWAAYPHGAAQLGVRLSRTEAVKVAQKILDDAG